MVSYIDAFAGYKQSDKFGDCRSNMLLQFIFKILIFFFFFELNYWKFKQHIINACPFCFKL